MTSSIEANPDVVICLSLQKRDINESGRSYEFIMDSATGSIIVNMEYSITSKPLAHNGYRARMGVQSARGFIKNHSKPMHLTNRHHAETGMSRILSYFIDSVRL